MAAIDKLKFKGAMGNMPFKSITMNEFIDALKQNGWRENHPLGHFYKRLVQYGPSFGIRTPSEFARALRDGTTEEAERGRKMRVCRGGSCWVVFQGNRFITIRYPDE